MTSSYRAVLLDLDNCLYSYDACHEPAFEVVLQELVKKTNRSADEVTTILQTCRYEVKRATGYTASSHSRLLYFQKAIEVLLGKTDLVLAQRLHELYWSTYFFHMTLYPGVKEFLLLLRSKNIRIAIVTDQAVDLQMKKLLHLSLQPFVDYLVTSEETGHDKPDTSMFELALQKLRLEPKDVFMIGDEPEKDIAGAKNLGINGMLATPAIFINGTLTQVFT